ncbi:DUF4328 domain-containing protein [Microbacterium sulfonylureivorans]|uniref:DUF4328 domain-containing protein n=1 Tax=Microbacterium sulfonylureivorans TaxID=2486854 RepID=UPI0013DFF4DD|nr:DUF4328 domain-containing protein [Microbacterium sulfonylureivorans]
MTLAVATQVLLIVCGVMSIVTIGVETFGITSATAYLDGYTSAIDLINTYDRVTLIVTILAAIAILATGVLWVLWQYRAAKHAAGQTRRSPGWHVGSWVVPIICLWFPYQNISDLWRATGRSRPAWQIVWWACWIVSSVLFQIATRIFAVAEDLELFRLGMSLSLAGEVFQMAAVPFAWLIVRDITLGITRRSAVGIPKMVS